MTQVPAGNCIGTRAFEGFIGCNCRPKNASCSRFSASSGESGGFGTRMNYASRSLYREGEMCIAIRTVHDGSHESLSYKPFPFYVWIRLDSTKPSSEKEWMYKIR